VVFEGLDEEAKEPSFADIRFLALYVALEAVDDVNHKRLDQPVHHIVPRIF